MLSETYSERPVLICGGIITSLGFTLASFARNITELTLSISLVGGIGCAMAFGPATVIVGHYFKRRLGIANAMQLMGGSVGQLTIPVSSFLLRKSENLKLVPKS